jgi:hypothetical protein
MKNLTRIGLLTILSTVALFLLSCSNEEEKTIWYEVSQADKEIQDCAPVQDVWWSYFVKITYSQRGRLKVAMYSIQKNLVYAGVYNKYTMTRVGHMYDFYTKQVTEQDLRDIKGASNVRVDGAWYEALACDRDLRKVAKYQYKNLTLSGWVFDEYGEIEKSWELNLEKLALNEAPSIIAPDYKMPSYPYHKN